MRKSRIMLGLSLASVMLATLLATISIARYPKRERKADEVQEVVTIKTHSGPRPGGKTDADFAIGASDTMVASGSMPRCDYQLEGKTLHIQAVASMFNKNPGSRFVWSVRVMAVGNSERVFQSKWYDDQIFEMPENHRLEPTFEDRVDLNVLPGRYYVETAVYEVYRGEKIDVLKDAKTLKYHIGPQQGHFVVVPK